VITVRVPPLRDRPEDLPHLIRAFLASLAATDKEHLFPPEVMAELARHEWPGNVRELRNYVERSLVLQTARMSPSADGVGPSSSRAPQAGAAAVDVGIPFKVAKDALIDGFERAYLRGILDAAGGNMTKAARMAGIDRMYLHRLVQKHGTRDPSPDGREPPSAQPRKGAE
jgi:DNA-binding NtrC family response regulator